jgi:multicomponent Na+:H+ antiporter subunit D
VSLHAHLPILQVVVPLLAAPLLAVLRGPRLAWGGALLTSLLSFVIAIALTVQVGAHGPLSYAVGDWPAPYGIELRIDALTVLMLLIVTGASTLALLAGRRSIEAGIGGEQQPLFSAAWLMAVSGLCGIAVAADAFNIFVFMEIGSLATYILVAGGNDRRALPATFKYLVMGTLGATFYLIGVGLLYMMTGTLNIADLQLRLAEVDSQTPVLVAAGAIAAGLALKAAVFPLHAWLPNAYTYAPNAVTAFIAACSTKVSLYVLLRMDFAVLQPNLAEHAQQFGLFMMPLALLAMLVAAGSAVFENHLKRLLAWSSISQIGYIVLGASLVSVTGLTAATLHMFNHALIKGTLFVAVMGLGQRLSALGLQDLAGVGRRMPWTMAAFVVAGLSLIGIPGTAGFISKWYLVLAALERPGPGVLLVAAILVSSLLALVYVWRVVERAYFGAPAASAGVAQGEAPVLCLLAVWIGALANVFFGLFPQLPLSLAREAARILMGAS